MKSEEHDAENESPDNDLLVNVARKDDVAIPKKRRMSVGLYKYNKAQHNIHLNDFSRFDKLRIPLLWQSIARRTLMLSDPFRNFKLLEISKQRVIRYQYNSMTKTWKTDEAYVKMEQKPFNQGAMRECYRLKKIPSYQTNTNDWKKAGNYVSKKYMQVVDRHVYFEDVRLQMDAKLWAEEFNRQPEVKKAVDIMRMCVIEFVDEPDRPLYHLETFIEGNYIKYNSNSGFVDEHTRNTPQAFSHFTFERSGHELIVVDVQGVGDLYTDPQIHTACKTGYGDGNLGCRGMALFFHTHKCNYVCEALGLAKFDLSSAEINMHDQKILSIQSATVGKLRNVQPVKSLRISRPSNSLEHALMDILEHHLDEEADPVCDNLNNSAYSTDKIYFKQMSSPDSGFGCDDDTLILLADDNGDSKLDDIKGHSKKKHIRCHFDSGLSESSRQSDDVDESYVGRNHKHRPSCVAFAMIEDLEMGTSILGEIHHELANMHECGRFINKENPDTDVDWESILFHEKIAAKLNFMDAIINMALYCLELPGGDLLKSCPIMPVDNDRADGWVFLETAANYGHKPSIFLMANSSDTVECAARGKNPDWLVVAHWLEKALENMNESDDSKGFDTLEEPSYQIKSRLASMYRTGGYGLEQNLERAAELYSEAAEEATTAMKGRLAAKFYELVEEINNEL